MIYFIPTPIWNLKDISLRSLGLFKELNYFLCEDTRTLKSLMSKYDIDYKDKHFFSLTSYTKIWKLDFYLDIARNHDIAVVSEAGTPWLSDPWKELVRVSRENDIDFDVLPWANALIPAVVSAFFDSSKFLFLWFLPVKKWRKTMIKKIVESEYPVFIYESVYRLEKTLKQLQENNFNWKVFVIREISKLYQQKVFWTVDEILHKIKEGGMKLKWEFVVWIINNT